MILFFGCLIDGCLWQISFPARCALALLCSPLFISVPPYWNNRLAMKNIGENLRSALFHLPLSPCLLDNGWEKLDDTPIVGTSKP